MNFKYFSRAVLRGVGQIMLQKNQITGFIFLIGLCFASPLFAFAALVGSAIGTRVAELFGYHEYDIDDGLYGYNGALVAIAIVFLYHLSLVTLLLLIVGVLISVSFMHSLLRKGYKPYTFPFVAVMWIIVIAVNAMHFIPLNLIPALTVAPNAIFSGITLGFSQVMLATSLMTGFLFLIGIAVNSWTASVYALLGSAVGFFVSALFFPNMLPAISMGLFGYNGVLCGLAFAEKKWHSWLFAILAVVLSVLFMRGFLALNILAFTAPFVFAAWCVLALKMD